MKISKKKLRNIIKEEVDSVLFENEIQRKLKSALPTILRNDTAAKIFNVTKKAATDKQISVNDLLNVSKGLYNAVKSGKKSADIAVKDPSALKKLGLDIIIGDITQDISGPRIPLSKNITGDRKDYGRTYGATLRLTLENINI